MNMMSTIKARDDAGVTPANENGAPTVAVIGGGAAGMMAAIAAARMGAVVFLFEKNDRPGKKLRITGKGRCNLTNDCSVQEFLPNVPTNPRFLYSALNRLSPADTKEFFEELGVPLKTERGRRVFPVSDRALDIVNALIDECRRAGVKILHAGVREILTADGRVTGLTTNRESFSADAVIVCTGGVSYPLTGSTGDGYRFAERAGHRVVTPTPSLVPLVCGGNDCQRMQGLSLKNVALRIRRTADEKVIYEDFGEMLFTHFGLSGPMVLSASAHIPDPAPGRYAAEIDFKPALDAAKLDARILSDFAAYANRDMINALSDLLPLKSVPLMIEHAGIDPRKKVNLVTREERERLLGAIKGFRIPILRARPIDEAIVTRGGVDVKEIDPKTMASKKVAGLYFAGEVLDVDAYTGGFNLQIAFATGTLAGESAALAGFEKLSGD